MKHSIIILAVCAWASMAVSSPTRSRVPRQLVLEPEVAEASGGPEAKTIGPDDVIIEEYDDEAGDTRFFSYVTVIQPPHSRDPEVVFQEKPLDAKLLYNTDEAPDVTN